MSSLSLSPSPSSSPLLSLSPSPSLSFSLPFPLFSLFLSPPSDSTTPRYKMSLPSQPCGLQRVSRDIIVACMDDTLTSYSHKGRKQWSLRLPASIMCVELLHYRPRSFKAVLVALQNGEVRIYKDKFLINCITMDVSDCPYSTV